MTKSVTIVGPLSSCADTNREIERPQYVIAGIVSKETVCCVGGKVKH